MTCSDACGAYPAGAGPDDEKIDVVIRHHDPVKTPKCPTGRAASERVATLLQFVAHQGHHLVAETIGPVLCEFKTFISNLRLLVEQFCPGRCPVEREHVLEFLLGEMGRVKLGHLVR